MGMDGYISSLQYTAATVFSQDYAKAGAANFRGNLDLQLQLLVVHVGPLFPGLVETGCGIWRRV